MEFITGGALWTTFYFVAYDLLSIKKMNNKSAPQKIDCELKKKLAYFGSGLSIILTDPAKARLLFKLSHFYRMESLKPMHECRISYRSPKWPCRKENTIMQEEET